MKALVQINIEPKIGMIVEALKGRWKMSHNSNIIEALNTLGIKHCCYNCVHRFCIDEEDGDYTCRIEKENFYKQSDYENNDCLDFELDTGDLEIEELKDD